MSADFKIGCGSVVFREYELERVLDAIYAAGYRYFETQATNPWCMHVVVDRDDPVRFADMAKAHGFLGVTSLWTAEGALIPAADSCVDTIKRAIEWAAAANIPIVDLGDGYRPDDMSEDDAFKRLSERLLELIEAAEKYDVTLALEPHGSFSLTANGLERILSISSSKHFGINYDCANIRRAGFIETRDGARRGGRLARQTKPFSQPLETHPPSRTRAKLSRSRHCAVSSRASSTSTRRTLTSAAAAFRSDRVSSTSPAVFCCCAKPATPARCRSKPRAECRSTNPIASPPRATSFLRG